MLTLAASCSESTKPGTTGGSGGSASGSGGSASGSGGSVSGSGGSASGSGGSASGSGGSAGGSGGSGGGSAGSTDAGRDSSGTGGTAPTVDARLDVGVGEMPVAACAEGAPFPALRQTTVAMATGPIDLVGHPSDPGTAYVLERRGQVRVLKDGMLATPPVVTLSGVATDNERGALAMTLHPKFDENGRLFVFFTKPDTTVEEWKITAGVGARVKELYSFPHSSGWHQGGQVAFGPDGMLYFSVGENHQGGNAPQPNGRLGRIMRIDADTGMPPAAGNLMGYTWSHGLRNPYRISFDRLTGDLYIADVGQGAQEEINFELKGQGGKNYGWPAAEGMLGTGGVRPVHTYPRSGGNAIIGGYVYRGSKYPCLRGHYFYGDNGSNQVRSLLMREGAATDHRNHGPLSGNAGGSIWSFGEDGAGEIYILRSGGRISRIDAN